jgi:DNA (cytosine-5)-methyltransferase 1
MTWYANQFADFPHGLAFRSYGASHATYFVSPAGYLPSMATTFIDLFAGIGGFHAAAGAFGWDCVFANEWDPEAAAVYEKNWELNPLGNIHDFTRGEKKRPIPKHDVLFGGFPCQPFSKSGKQLGMEEDRGSLFHDIAYILEKHQPSMVFLENVRNIAGPRHEHEWKYIIQKLRALGYRVSSKPLVVSPHRIPPAFGGKPQARERVFIVGTRLPRKNHSLRHDDTPLEFPTDFDRWNIENWNLLKDLPLEKNTPSIFMKYRISNDEKLVLDAWDDLVKQMLIHRDGLKLPGFPLWSDLWGKKPIYEKDISAPEWKINFEKKNRQFYLEHKEIIDDWFEKYPVIRSSTPSKRKLEWQAQDMESIWDGLIHFRPSGIRVKRATYVPALVAITQTTIFGPYARRITPREAARLQGMFEDFSFGSQSDSASYKQLGNGVSVGAVYQVIRAAVQRDQEILEKTNPDLLECVRNAAITPYSKQKQAVKNRIRSL